MRLRINPIRQSSSFSFRTPLRTIFCFAKISMPSRKNIPIISTLSIYWTNPDPTGPVSRQQKSDDESETHSFRFRTLWVHNGRDNKEACGTTFVGQQGEDLRLRYVITSSCIFVLTPDQKRLRTAGPRRCGSWQEGRFQAGGTKRKLKGTRLHRRSGGHLT